MFIPETQAQSPTPKDSRWAWFVVAALIGFVLVQMALIRIAVKNFEGPDEVDYYRMGLEHSKEIQRREQQRQLGWVLHFQPGSQGLKVQILDPEGQAVEGKLTLLARRPATRSQDQRLEGQPVEGGWLVDWRAAPGAWRLDFELEQAGRVWRQSRRIYGESSP